MRDLIINTKNAKKNEAFIKALKSIHSIKDNMDIEKQRRSQETLGNLFSPTRGIDYESFKIGDMCAEWIRNSKGCDRSKVILYCHGGAYLTGNISYSRIIGSKLAKITGFIVLTIEYRLAPENPYPSQLEDAYSAWNYLKECGYSSDNIALVGESAGGNLILSLANYLKLNNKSLPMAMVCMSPWTDLTATGESYETKKELDPILTYEFLKSATLDYAANNNLSDPLISPLYGDFQGFPPTLIQVGSNEILLSDSINLRDRLLSCNIECHLEVWEGMWHVFQLFPMKKATRAMQNVAIFLTSNFNKIHTIL